MSGLKRLVFEKNTLHSLQSLFFSCFCLIAFLNSAEFTQAETKLQIIFCADTNAEGVGPMVAGDVSSVRTLFLENVPQHLYRFHALTGSDASAEHIGNKIRAVPIDSDDVLVFFYSGHGAFDTNENEHFMTLTNGDNIRRSDLLEVIQSRGAKLDVLITNSCSNFVKFDVNSPSPNGVQRLKPLFHELFFKPRGLVNISATMPGQTAITGSAGSAFYRGFNGALYDSERRISWTQIIYETNKNSKNDGAFNDAKVDQTAYAVSPLPKPSNNNAPPRQKYWLGAYAQAYSAGGVEITKVVDNSPASQIRDSQNNSFRLVPFRDIVTHVNGRTVNNNDQFIAAIRASGKVAKLQVYDKQTRHSGAYNAYLTPIK